MGEEQSSSGCAGKLVVGCLIVSILAAVGAVGAYYWVTAYARDKAGTFLVDTADEYFKKQNLPAEEAEAAMVEVRKLGDKIKNGELSMAQMESMAKKLMNGPLPMFVVAKGFEKQCMEKANLSAAEKAAVEKNLSRMVHGLTSKKIDLKQVQPVFEPLMEKVEEIKNGVRKEKTQFKKNPTEKEIQEAIVRLGKLVNIAGIPDQKFRFELGSEVARILKDDIEQPE